MYTIERQICVGDVEVKATIGFDLADPFDCSEPVIREVWVEARGGLVALKDSHWPELDWSLEDAMCTYVRESEYGSWIDYQCDRERDRRMGV